MADINDFVEIKFTEHRLEIPETVPKNWVRYCSTRTIEDPRYALLAGNVECFELQESTANTFSMVPYPNLDAKTAQTISDNAEAIDKRIVSSRDFTHDYFSISTLKRSYLIRSADASILETPQYLWMRVAIGIHGDDLESAFKTYDLLSEGFFTFATPTLFNSGTINPQMSSCFLLAMKDDSIKGIFDTVADCADISKLAGGIGLHIHNIRGAGAPIKGTNGFSNGIVPMLKVFNATARYVDQGGGKRKGSIAVYLQPWHWDIEDFLRLKKNTGDENLRTRDLFPALWVSDLFMERVQTDADWTLFCPSQTSDLNELVGDAFKERYQEYESDETVRKKTIKARTIWNSILESQVETGTPYILYKDACNLKSNQKNLGTIKSSNLCTEIVEYSDSDQTAVCNLASICLPRFVEQDGFNFKKLQNVVRHVVISMNVVIDKNKYPTEGARASNTSARPIGIGVQGLSDVFQMLDLPYDCPDSEDLDALIFETIYFAAMTASADLAKEYGSYERFEGSPASKGIFQFDFWKPKAKLHYDWANLKETVRTTGLRNSLLTAVMPTASTSQIQGNTEEVVVPHSNLFSRRTLAGNFLVVNRILVFKLMQRGLWTKTMQQQLLKNRGSVQDIEGMPDDIKEIFKTIWETKMKDFIDHAVARGPFIDQSQSMSLYFAEPDDRKISSALFYAWRSGLKTGCKLKRF
tara:strand:- start:2603 stop:4690 length:2088 start_codon:yes stop_codon:yes gene_type:complete